MSVGTEQEINIHVKHKAKKMQYIAPSNNQGHSPWSLMFSWNFQIIYNLGQSACIFPRNQNHQPPQTYLRNHYIQNNAINPLAWSPPCPSVICRAQHAQAQVIVSQTMSTPIQVRAFQTAWDTSCPTTFLHPRVPCFIFLYRLWLYSSY